MHVGSYVRLADRAVSALPTQAFSGAQLLGIYGVPVIRCAAGKRRSIVAIVIAFSYPGLRADLAVYWQANFGATPVPVIQVHTMPGATFDAGWAVEACLDVQMVCTVNADATVWVVEATSDSLVDMLAAVDHATGVIGADVVSMSWGLGDDAALAPLAPRLAAASVCYCAASGDANVASWPSVLASCVAVGGTTLFWTPCAKGRFQGIMAPYSRTERTWEQAGCGFSASVPQPPFQAALGSRTHRSVPDVSLVANPRTGVFVVYDGTWRVLGGTSVGTPLFAGMLSLANQMRFNVGKPALSTAAVQARMYTYIYATPRRYAADFYDVTVGTDVGSPGVVYTEGAGFRIPTGLGSPNCASLCVDLLGT